MGLGDKAQDEDVVCGQSSAEDQQVRGQLREQFLRLMSHLAGGQSCRIKLYENASDHTCELRGFNPSLEHIIVENLSTNYPQPVKRAILRTSDIISMHFEVDHLPNEQKQYNL